MGSKLFQTVWIKHIELKNRFVRSATHEGMATVDGRPTDTLNHLYEELAKGDIGLIVTGTAMVDAYKNLPDIEGLPFPLAIDEDKYISCWAPIIENVHALGSKIAMQIGHPGRQEDPNLRGSLPLAPSPVPVEDTAIVPREMTMDDIEHMIEGFAQCCRRVKDAGFDAVQLHGSHGYLISNFISPYANQRHDHYGGSTENRARFIVDIVKRAKALVGPDYPIMIKMNFDDFIEGGLNINEAVEIAAIIVDAGIDCIEVSGGTQAKKGLTIAAKGINRQEKEAYFRAYAKALKERVQVPVILVGGHRSLENIEEIIDENVCDCVSMCRPLIREPGLIKRWKEGHHEKATCMSCNKCFDNWYYRPLRCYMDHPVE